MGNSAKHCVSASKQSQALQPKTTKDQICIADLSQQYSTTLFSKKRNIECSFSERREIPV